MSVILLSRTNYVYILSHLEPSRHSKEATFGTIPFIQDFHGKYRYNEEALPELVNHWKALNEISYKCRYNEPNVATEQDVTYKDIQSGKRGFMQLLKLLECLRYNIEISTIDAAFLAKSPCCPQDWVVKKGIYLDAYERLEAIILHLLHQAVDTISEYKNALWVLR